MVGQKFKILYPNIFSFKEEKRSLVSGGEKKWKNDFDQLSGWSFAFCTVL
jgi:hypothetical protein